MKKIIIPVILFLALIIVLYFLVKPFIIYEGNIYFKKETVSSYTLYQKKDYRQNVPDMIEDIYRKDNKIYYFSTPQSGNYLLVKDSKRYTLKDALTHQLVSPEDIMEVIAELKIRDEN